MNKMIIYSWEDDYLYVDLAYIDECDYKKAIKLIKNTGAFNMIHENHKDIVFEFYPNNDEEEEILNTVYCDMEQLNYDISTR